VELYVIHSIIKYVTTLWKLLSFQRTVHVFAMSVCRLTE
jgi:hypothetical protein